MRKPRIFIDGQAGTTGLQIHQLLASDGNGDIDIVSIDASDRKKEQVRRQLLNDVDVAILCLPDDAAKEAVSWIENDKVRVLDASSAHRVAPEWVYGFPELRPEQASRIAQARISRGLRYHSSRNRNRRSLALPSKMEKAVDTAEPTAAWSALGSKG